MSGTEMSYAHTSLSHLIQSQAGRIINQAKYNKSYNKEIYVYADCTEVTMYA